MGLFIICLGGYNSTCCWWISSCVKEHLYMEVRMNDSVRQQSLLMKSIHSSKCLTSVNEAWSCLADVLSLSQFGTQCISTLMLYQDTVGGYLSPCSPCTLANALLVALCLADPCTSRSQQSLHISSTNRTPLALNRLSIITIFYNQPVFECPQGIFNYPHPVQVFISKLIRSVLSPDTLPLLIFPKLSHQQILPYI